MNGGYKIWFSFISLSWTVSWNNSTCKKSYPTLRLPIKVHQFILDMQSDNKPMEKSQTWYF